MSTVFCRNSKLGLEVLVGTVKTDDVQGGTYYEAENVVVHEDYHPSSKMKRAGDIAVLRVMGTFDFNDRVQPIQLAKDEPEHGANASEQKKN